MMKDKAPELSALPGTEQMCFNFLLTKVTNICIFYEAFSESEYSFVTCPWNSDTAIAIF